MKVVVIIEGNDREGYGCWPEESMPYCSPIGHGETLEECKKDFIQCLDEIQEWSREDGVEVPVVTDIEWRMAS